MSDDSRIPIAYYGPYLYRSGKCAGRKYMQAIYADGSRGTTLYSRWLMEKHLGRRLLKSEEVDHINEDKTDDRIGNFQILSHGSNASKSSKKTPAELWFEFNCPVCGGLGKRAMRFVRRARKTGAAGPFCGKKCSRAWQTAHSC